MAIISSPIPSLFNGVSQQAAPLRNPSQCQLQENAYSDIATGLRKRPPTEHIAKLTAGDYSNSYIHTIVRDTVERYTVVISNGALAVYDMAGNAKVVNFPTGAAYLASGNPRVDFVAMTVADYTFIVNRSVIPAMGAAVTPFAIGGTKQKFSDLPAATASGNVWIINGDPANNFDDYYVLDNIGPVYTECAYPGQAYQFNPYTMPHQLIRNAGGDFTFSKVSWEDRLVGSLASNPPPSFIGSAIKDIFYHRNRLGILAGESFCLSRPGEYFSYWLQTLTAALDNDPIDGDASHNKVSLLNWAMPYNKSLLLFSDQTQFQVTGGEVLTPKTARADPTTEFDSTNRARPISLGNELFFAQERGDSAGLYEYYIDQVTVSNDASDTTAHVPTYLPKTITKLAGCSPENLVYALSDVAKNNVYVHKYYWKSNEKVQSSWSMFTFPVTDNILNVDFIGQTAYFLIQRADGCYLESMFMRANATDTGFPYKLLLDRRVSVTGVYDAGNNWTTWTLPYSDDNTMQVVLGSAFGSDAGMLLQTTRPTSFQIRAVGDYSAHPAFVGRQYVKRYRFSQLYYRDAKGAVQSGRLQIGKMTLAFDNSAYFKVEVTPPQRSTYTYTMTGKFAGAVVLGTPAVISGAFAFPVKSRNAGLTIDIVNDSPYPSTIQSAEWEGDFVIYSQRVQG